MTVNTIKPLNSTFQMLYVIAIFMIIDGHLGTYDYLSFDNLLRYQNYHMALFIFTSGYFLNFERHPQEFFRHKIKHILLPLYLWNFIYGLVCLYLNHVHNFHIGGEFTLYNLLYAPLVDGHQFIYNMASWFLVPLFFVQSIAYLILLPFQKLSNTNKTITYIIFFIISLILGSFALTYGPENHAQRNLTLMCLRIFYFLPALAFGILYKHCLEKYKTPPFYLFILLSLIWGLTTAFPNYNHIPSWLDTPTASPLVIYTISFLAILFWVRIAKICAPILEKSTFLQQISTHTLDLMLHHFACFMLIKSLFNFFNAPNFNQHLYHTDIWYNYFPYHNENIALLYIFITIVIILFTKFTFRKIYDKINKVLSVH